MDTTFEFFEGTATVNSTTPRVTVRKSGQLVLTEAAVALLGEGVDQVQIGYNDKARAVGIKAATEGGGAQAPDTAERRSKLVDAKRFFAHRGLAVDKARGLRSRAEKRGLLDRHDLPGDLRRVLRVAAMHDTFTCTGQLPVALLLPFLAAGFDLEVSAYPVDEDPPSQVRSDRMPTEDS